jgi:hypothetical protein
VARTDQGENLTLGEYLPGRVQSIGMFWLWDFDELRLPVLLPEAIRDSSVVNALRTAADLHIAFVNDAAKSTSSNAPGRNSPWNSSARTLIPSHGAGAEGGQALPVMLNFGASGFDGVGKKIGKGKGGGGVAPDTWGGGNVTPPGATKKGGTGGEPGAGSCLRGSTKLAMARGSLGSPGGAGGTGRCGHDGENADDFGGMLAVTHSRAVPVAPATSSSGGSSSGPQVRSHGRARRLRGPCAVRGDVCQAKEARTLPLTVPSGSTFSGVKAARTSARPSRPGPPSTARRATRRPRPHGAG